MDKLNLDEIIWQIVDSVPKGKVVTYGQIAKLAGYPNHARYVGSTLKKLPKDTTLPWHRVVNAQGKSSFPSHSQAFKKQCSLLEKEGVIFIGSKLSLGVYGWSV